MSVNITFQAVDGTPEIRDAIEEHFAELGGVDKIN